MAVNKPDVQDKVDVVTAAIVGKVSKEANTARLEKALENLAKETKKLNQLNREILDVVRDLNKKDQPAPQAENQPQQSRRPRS